MSIMQPLGVSGGGMINASFFLAFDLSEKVRVDPRGIFLVDLFRGRTSNVSFV